MGRLIEGVWDCTYCGSKKIKGSIRVCPVCGRQRDKDIKFYMDNPNNYVAEDVAKTINRNPDWLCSYCDALNSDDVHECHICGSSREDSEQNYFEHQAEIEARRSEKKRMVDLENNHPDDDEKYDVAPNGLPIYRGHHPIGEQEDERSFEYADAQYDSSSENTHAYMRNDDASHSSYARRNRESKASNSFVNVRWGNLFKIGAGVLAAVMLIMCLVWAFSPKIQEVTVQDFSWERSINIEEYVTVERSDWGLPAGGRLLYSQTEIRGYTQVIDHYETKTRTYTEEGLDHYEEYVSGYRDLGNGYFEEIISQRPVYRTETKTETYQEPVYRDEPIYATKYYYEIDVWQYAFSYKTSGNDKDPYWEEFTLKDKQRESGRIETYEIAVINEGGEEKTYSFDFDVWNSLEKGEKVTIKVNLLGQAQLVTD